jgi:hypothetical protein
VFPCERFETADFEIKGVVVAVIEFCKGTDEGEITENLLENVWLTTWVIYMVMNAG